jgi:hypothetical protein
MSIAQSVAYAFIGLPNQGDGDTMVCLLLLCVLRVGIKRVFHAL